MRCFCFTKIDEEEVHACDRSGRVEFELVEHVVDAISTKGDAHARESRKSKDAGEIVVASTARDGTNFDIEDATRVVVQTTCKCEVEF